MKWGVPFPLENATFWGPRSFEVAIIWPAMYHVSPVFFLQTIRDNIPVFSSIASWNSGPSKMLLSRCWIVGPEWKIKHAYQITLVSYWTQPIAFWAAFRIPKFKHVFFPIYWGKNAHQFVLSLLICFFFWPGEDIFHTTTNSHTQLQQTQIQVVTKQLKRQHWQDQLYVYNRCKLHTCWNTWKQI